MKEGSKKGLHGLNTFSSRLLPTEGIQPHHGAKEGHRAKKKRNVPLTGPSLDYAWDLHIRGPEERGLGKGDGETEGGRE
jgi:hypothetical protein